VKISPKLIHWADMIFAMEGKQAIFIDRKFRLEIRNKKVINLNIPDCYYFMETELGQLIKSKVPTYLEE
jgi:protein-tyrosine phosphatase